MVSLQQCWTQPGRAALSKYGLGLRRFLGYGDAQTLLCMTIVDCETVPPDGFNSEASVSVFSSSGRHKIPAADFVAMHRACAPDMVVCLADVQTGEATQNRQKKALKRTLAFLDEVIAAKLVGGLFAAVVGGKSPELRAFCAKEVAGRDSAAVAGFMLEGLDCGVAEPDRTACVRAVLRVLPAAKPRAIRGAFGPFQVLALVEQGVDLFDGAYPVQMAERGQAFNWRFGARVAIVGAGSTGASPTTTTDNDVTGPMLINLWDAKYEADFTELATVRYTRSYVHHLLNTHEMLAMVTLTTHNVSRFHQFFAEIRASVSAGTFDADVAAFAARYVLAPAGPE